MKSATASALVFAFTALTVRAGAASDADWSRVRRLEPGTEIVVTISGAAAARAFFVSADESTLTLRKLQQSTVATPRADVVQVAVTRRGRGFWGHAGPVGGYFVGAFAGGFATGLACQAVRGASRCDSGAFLLGMVGGGLAGGTYGFHAARRETEEVIYVRASSLHEKTIDP